ncbi:putative inorganic phosphate cotransporter isoform X2 [Pectinophora gossypiella]|uniref:putative inorganic phosphate cotransporter isoform X1 n=1 Tax=Pectinophora gossypiella TaxID=13191 RepID=UPI00214E0C9F|nr:putative inorganic phosphate cotransporter isoform X1 [Pectinophora gossypiella]XP_049873030.1 putative inorganic phosphate cotransporter isoform X2 [Pectinophora gossypiella]
MSVEENLTKTMKPRSVLGIRHVQILMLALSMAISYSMRINMSLAIVAMTDQTKEGAFDWSVQIQSVILSSFFWGYVILQVPAGELAARFGGKLLLLINMSVNATVSLIIPLCSHYGGWQLVCLCRVMQGLSQGFLFPATHNLLGKWVPLDEKSRLGALVYSGSPIGMALQNLSSGFIAEYWGWPSIFYMNGALAAIWTAIYVFIGADSPQSSHVISEEERFHIQNSLGHVGGHKKLKTPWKSIWTSVPFLALMIAHGGQNWGFFTLMTEIPSYMANVLGADIKKNGVLSALPYIAAYIMSFPVGFTADYIMKKKLIGITATRKMFNSIALYGAATVLIGLSYIPSDSMTLAVSVLVLVMAINAAHYAGFILVHIDMSPNFAGSLMGITNCFANIISIIAPLAAGAMLNDETDPVEWRKVFFVTSAFYVFANTIFVIFGSCEVQKWNDVPEERSSPEKPEKEA